MDFIANQNEINFSVSTREKSFIASDFYLFVDNIESYITDFEDLEGYFRNEAKKYIRKKDSSSVLEEEPSKLSSAYQKSNRETEELSKLLSRKVFSLIRESNYEVGKVSVADKEIEHILEEYGSAFIYLVLGHIWHECSRSQNHVDYAHFLNCLMNISYLIDTDLIVTYAVSAVMHKNVVVREAGLALFESWDNPEYRDHLNNMADTGIEWLDQYKKDVMESLE